MAEQRASDADREQAADRLRLAGGDGRLTVEELGERVQQAYTSRSRGELDRLLEDLGEPHELTRAQGASGLSVRPGPGGSRWVVSLMSGATRVGRWRVTARSTVLSVMGGSEVDFGEAELAADEITVTVISLMGSAELYVPEDVRLDITDVGLMGANDVERGTPESERPTGPVLHLRLISIMGSASVRRGSRTEWRARRKQRREERRRLRD